MRFHLALIVLLCVPSFACSEVLTSGQYFVTQSWTQESGFKRPYYVRVPRSSQQQKLPVFMFLHGNGGSGNAAMNGFSSRHREIARRHIMVFPSGYLKSWNIVNERSKADDRGFIEAIIGKLSAYHNVDRDNFTVMGSSNGAALVNQLAIESRLPGVRNYISAVSPLNACQHDGKAFKAKGDHNDYAVVANPMTGKRLLNISGSDDRLVPYRGGRSAVIPAKDGKLGFVAAEESAFLWAKQMGYDGEQLARASRVDGRLEFFQYLDGDVVHIKVVGEGHGASRAINESILLNFLKGTDVVTR